jgi:hypothetical protein
MLLASDSDGGQDIKFFLPKENCRELHRFLLI